MIIKSNGYKKRLCVDLYNSTSSLAGAKKNGNHKAREEKSGKRGKYNKDNNKRQLRIIVMTCAVVCLYL